MPHNRLDWSNCQRWIAPAFAKRSDWSNLSLMSELADMQTIRESLKRIMEQKGIKPTTLSLKVGTNRTLVKDLLGKTADIQISTLTKLASALNVQLADLLASPRVSVVGYIGAGGSIIFEDMGNEETVVRPPGIDGPLVALVVRGDSMFPRYKDGDIIYIQRTHDGILPEYLGDDCAVRLVSGETYIKQIIRGSEEGKFTLISYNAPPMEDVEIEWATPVAFMMTAKARQLFR